MGHTHQHHRDTELVRPYRNRRKQALAVGIMASLWKLHFLCLVSMVSFVSLSSARRAPADLCIVNEVTCDANMHCESLTGTCVCNAGYADTPSGCQIEDVCHPRVEACKNGGTCIEGAEIGAYTCECADGYTDDNCTTNIDDCIVHTCVNGVCVDGVNTYTCDCSGSGFTGDICDTNIDDCPGNECVNGYCVDGVNDYTCVCTAGYEGKHCNIDTDDCSPNPCQNDGTCMDGVDSYTCQCPHTHYGTICENARGRPSG